MAWSWLGFKSCVLCLFFQTVLYNRQDKRNTLGLANPTQDTYTVVCINTLQSTHKFTCTAAACTNPICGNYQLECCVCKHIYSVQCVVYTHTHTLHSGLYPTFKGIEGSLNRLDPTSNSAFEYLQQLWPCSLCELIALEINRYAMQKGRSKWNNTTTAEIWKFQFLGLPVLRDYMSC